MPRPNRPKFNRANATGRSEHSIERFARLPHSILISSAYRSLDLTARALLTDLVMLESGKNNGELWLSVKDATDRLGLSDQRAAMRGFNDLQDRGLIVMTQDAHFNIKTASSARARRWALTWLAIGKKPPTNGWQSYQPPGKTKASRTADKGLKAMSRYRKTLALEKNSG